MVSSFFREDPFTIAPESNEAPPRELCFPARRLERAIAALVVANANRVIHGRDKYFAVADFSSLRGLQDGLHDFSRLRFRQYQFQFYLRQHIHRIFAPAIYLCMAFLSAVSPYFSHRDTFHTNFPQCLFHGFKSRRLDDCFNLLHSFPLSVEKFFDHGWRTRAGEPTRYAWHHAPARTSAPITKFRFLQLKICVGFPSSSQIHCHAKQSS